jgi:hypothetical protein
VFNALLAGVIGIKHRGPTTHAQLLGHIKNFSARHMGRGTTEDQHRGVTVSGPYCDHRLLSVTELEACALAVQSLHIGDGYLCAAEDPLLILAAKTFQVDIVHKFLGNSFLFEVSEPIRTVFLASSRGHMTHLSNVEMSKQT